MTLVQALSEHGFGWVQVPRRNPTRPILNAKRAGNLVFVSGQVPIDEGEVITGKVDDDTLWRAFHAATLCALACLYAAGSAVDPESIEGVASMHVYVNCAPGFTDTSSVADAASDFLKSVFGEAGECARAATGASELPLNAAVEITMVVTVR